MNYAAEIGFRYLRSKKQKTISVITFIAIGGVALGVAALLSVIAITNGMQSEFRDKVLGVNAHVLVMKYGNDFEEYEDVMARSLEMPEVIGAAPFVINEMMLSKGERSAGVLVKGVDPDVLSTVLDLPQQIIRGSLEGLRVPGARPPSREQDEERVREGGVDLDRYLRAIRDGASPEEAERIAKGATAPPAENSAHEADPDVIDALPTVAVPSPEQAEAALQGQRTGGAVPDTLTSGEASAPVVPTERLPGILVGKTLAESLDLEVGDRVSVVSPLSGLDTSMFRAEAKTPRSREFRVIGVFAAGFQEYDSHLVYTDLYEAEALLDHGDSATGVEIRLRDIEEAPTIARRIARVLGGGPYHTLDWRELNSNLFTALEIQKIMLSLVIATIVFVAAFNVIGTLIMIVIEKKKEIAILKAMGARDHHILTVFLVQGVTIGLVGTALGVLIGGGVCAYLEAVPIPLDPRVYLIDHVPVRTGWAEFAVTISTALGICLTATLLPSWWAARLLPADGVRWE